mgnify:CR=1 FL=1
MNRVFDVFPALVRLAPPESFSVDTYTEFSTTGDAPQGTRRIDKTRVVLVNSTLVIARDDPNGPQVVFRENILAHHKEGKIWKVFTQTGKAIAVTKDSNCSCGSRLRGWNPYGNIVFSSEDPSE